MMSNCKICGSTSINPHLHGRKANVDLDLCDVCYWEEQTAVLTDILRVPEPILDEYNDFLSNNDDYAYINIERKLKKVLEKCNV